MFHVKHLKNENIKFFLQVLRRKYWQSIVCDEPLKEAVETVISKYGRELPLVLFRNSQAILVTGQEKQIVS